MLEDNPVAPLPDEASGEVRHEHATGASAAPGSSTADLAAAVAKPEERETLPETSDSDMDLPETLVMDEVVTIDQGTEREIGERVANMDDQETDWSPSSRALLVVASVEDQPLTDLTAHQQEAETGEALGLYAEEPEPESQGWRGWPVLMAIGLVCVVSFGGSLFLFTRPCALGSCQPLELAERLQAQAITQVNADIYGLTPADLVQARQQLLRAIDALGEVPRWSEAAQTANRLLPEYRAQLKTLDLIIAAQDKATAAAQRSQNPPHPVAEWQAIHALWQAAIASLAKVPQTSELAPLAEHKRVEYQVNLNAIAQRIRQEQESDRHLAAAQRAAAAAASRQAYASTLADWQELATLWESAIRPLQLIPSGTMAHATATDRLLYYQGKLNTVRARITQEESAAATYRKAVQLAERAKAHERQNLWSKAINDWQAARALLQEIPPDTLLAAQVQSLMSTYDQAMRSAQSNWVAFNNLQNLRNDLEQACGGQPRRCTHSVSATAITVTLTPDYEATLHTAERLQSELVRAEITNQWQALDFTLQSISQNAGIPVLVYDSTGSLLVTHTPNG